MTEIITMIFLITINGDNEDDNEDDGDHDGNDDDDNHDEDGKNYGYPPQVLF